MNVAAGESLTTSFRKAFAVAEFNGTYYDTLEDAMSAATEGSTVTLLNDATLSTKLTINKSVTIEGSNHKITGNANDTDVYIEVTKGVFSVKDATLTGFGSSVAGTQSGVGVIKVPYNATVGTEVNLTNVTIKDFHRAALDIRSGNFALNDCNIDCANANEGSLTKGILAGLATNKVTGVVNKNNHNKQRI